MPTPGIAARRAARNAGKAEGELSDSDNPNGIDKGAIHEAQLKDPTGDTVLVPTSDDIDVDTTDMPDLEQDSAKTKGGDQNLDDEEPRSPYDDRLAVDDDDETPGGRERRTPRQRRNAAAQRRKEQSNQELQLLRQKLDQMERLVGGLANGHVGLARSSLGQQLSSARTALSMAEAELDKAYKEDDRRAIDEYKDLRDQARDRVRQLQEAEQRFAQGGPAAPNGGGQVPPQQRREMSPAQQRQIERAQQFSEIFAERFPFFDPDSDDDDSRLIIALDAQVEEDGYLPHTKAYWEELERRAAKRGLVPEGADSQDQEDDPPTRRQSRQEAPRRRAGPPTGAVRGGQRNPGTNNGKTDLPEHLINSLREMGLVGNLEKKDAEKRDRIIKRYRQNVANERAAAANRS